MGCGCLCVLMVCCAHAQCTVGIGYCIMLLSCQREGGNRSNLCIRDLGQRHCLVGSLAGAAHLLKANTGVQRGAQWEQKSHVEHKGKSSFDFDFQY
jgi:hypothetical protein